MDPNKPPSFDSMDREGNSAEILLQEDAGTETIDLNGLFGKEVTDSGSYNIGDDIWTSTFGKVIQSLPIPVFLIDESRSVIAANQACSKIDAGYEMVVHKPFFRLFVNPSDALQSESLVNKVFSTRKTSAWEAPLRIDETTIWGRLTFRAIRIRRQRFLLVLVEDLSLEKKQSLQDRKYKEELEKCVKERTEELRRLNEELRNEIAERNRSEKALRIIVDNLPIAVFAKSAEDHRFILWNKASEELFGHSRKQVLGKNDYDFFPKEQADFFWKKDKETLESGVVIDIPEEPILTKNMGTRLLHTRKVPLYGRLGRPHSLLGISQDITERRQAETALLREKSFSDAMIDVLPGTFYLFDEQGTLLRWNKNLEQMAQDLGRDILSMGPLDFFVGDDRRRVDEAVQRGFSEGETSVEAEITLGNRNKTPYLFTAKRVFLYDKQCLMGVGIDIIDRRKTEAALKEIQRQQRALLDNIPDLAWLKDRESRFIAANQSFGKACGVAPDLLTGKTDLDVWPVELAERYRADDREVMATGKRKRVEEPLADKDGNTTWIETIKTVIHSDTGEIIGTAGIARDISERKRSEDALRVSEERYRGLFENAPIMYVITRNEQGVPFISDCNELFLRSVGYTREEVLGKPLGDFYSPESRSELLEGGGYGRALTGQFFMGERSLTTRDGRLIPTLLYTATELDPWGQVIGTRAMFVDISESKQAEEARIRSEKKYRALFDESRDGVYAVLREGPITDANPSFLEMFGYTREEMIGKDILELYMNPAERPKFQREIEKERSVKDYEVVFRKKDGSQIDCLLTSSVQFADDGAIVGYRGIVRDVTERKRTAKALEESEKRYRMLFEAAGDAILILRADGDEPGRILSANSEAAKMHGYTVSEVLTMNIADLDTPEESSKVSERMERLLRGETLREVATHKRKDGTVFPIEINARLIEIGSRKYVLAIDRDVTEREKAQTALRESEQRLRLINDSSPVGIRIVQDGKYAYVNPAFVRMFDYEAPEDIIGLPVEALYAPESRDLILRRRADRPEGKTLPSHYEAIGMTRSGKRFDVEAWGTEIDYLGRRSSLAFVMDMSESKGLRLQLLQAQKMEAIGTLAGGIAHDFNNLLTVILGYSELIISEKTDGDSDYEDLAKIVHAARTAGDMVQRILAFSRKTETKPRPINLNKQVEQLRNMLSRLIPRTIEVEISLDPELPAVNADPTQIEQILMNLAVNARDAMPNGGRLLIETQTVLLDEMYCRLHLEAAQGRHAVLVVRDTGIGIDRSTMDRIFEPFYTTKKPGQGTGLGLAMVYGIVKAHGGHITCESELGRGTVFRIYLPAHEVERDADVRTSGQFVALGEGTILLVDDEELVRQLGQRILEKAGYTVITASNGREAIEVYKEKGPQISLVILDLIMPVMDGHQCLKEILRLDPNARVLIASGYSPDGTARETLEGGAEGFVKKPYNLKQLLKTVRNALNEK